PRSCARSCKARSAGSDRSPRPRNEHHDGRKQVRPPMSSGPDPRLPAEPTFADVMNGFSFDASRSPRRRRWGRRQNHEEPEPRGFTAAPAAAPPEPYGQPYGILPPSGQIDVSPPD